MLREPTKNDLIERIKYLEDELAKWRDLAIRQAGEINEKSNPNFVAPIEIEFDLFMSNLQVQELEEKVLRFRKLALPLARTAYSLRKHPIISDPKTCTNITISVMKDNYLPIHSSELRETLAEFADEFNIEYKVPRSESWPGKRHKS